MPRPGDRIERYEIVRVLGEGGMARVFLARHTALETLHAIKILTLTGPTLSDRLEAEGKAQARLRDDHIVRVSDVLTVDGMPALVMDYVDGPDLQRWIHEVRPDPALAEEVFRGIVAGVAAAHAAGIVHRDLKPANVLMAKDAQGRWLPKVGDFGLVKVVQGDEQAWKTRSGVPMGTPAYMAPEQIRNAAGVDRRADVWSLGCILYELLAHRTAFEGEDLMDIFDRVATGRRDPLPAHVPARLRAAVDACLAQDPARRPQDCAALLALLDGAAHALPAPAPATIADLGATLPGPTLGAPSGGTTLPGAVRAALARPTPTLAVGALGVLVLVTGIAMAGLLAIALLWWATRPDPTAACDPSAGHLGYAKLSGGPFGGKRAGSVWTVRADTPVLREVPPEGVLGTQVCTLPAGTRYTLAADPQDGWVAVVGSGIALPEEGAALPVEEEEEAAPGAPGEAKPCAGPKGELVGWFFTRPLPLAGAPAVGRSWTVSSPKDVVAEPRFDARVVCRLPSGASVPITREPVRDGKGWWVPLVGAD